MDVNSTAKTQNSFCLQRYKKERKCDTLQTRTRKRALTTAWIEESFVFYLAVFVSGSFLLSVRKPLTSSLFRSLRFALALPPFSRSVCISSTEQASSLTQLWIHWKSLSIMPWYDYLVVRLLIHSHHYITEESLWNYSAIYHSLLHSPYTLNERLLLHTGCLTHPVRPFMQY